MHAFRSYVLLASCACATAFAQTASLDTNVTKLVAAGGDLVLTATVVYDQQPSALGWSIALPSDWALVSVAGPNTPAVVPPAGSGGVLEFAFTSVPANRAQFAITAHYPANADSVVLTSTVFVRADGRLATLTPTPIRIAGKHTVADKRPEK